MKNQMKTKYFFISSIFLFAFLLSLSLVMGAVTVVKPTSGSNFTSTLFNCTYKNMTDTTNPTSGNTSFYQNGVAITCTLAIVNGSVTCTPTAGQLTDGLNQNIGCKVGNNTVGGVAWSTTNATGVNIYTSTPTCDLISLGKDTVEYMNPLGIDVTQTSTKDALSSLTYAWTLTDPNSNSQQTSTSSTPTFSGTDFDEIGTFTLALTVSDDFQNTATCTSKSIFVKGKDGAAIPQVVVSEITETAPINLFWWITGVLILLVLLGAVTFYVISSAKKR